MKVLVREECRGGLFGESSDAAKEKAAQVAAQLSGPSPDYIPATVAELKKQFADGPAAVFYEFLSQGTRGFVQERRMPPTATLKLRHSEDEENANRMQSSGIEMPELKAKAG